MIPSMPTATPHRSPVPEQANTPVPVSHQYLPVMITLILLVFFFVGFFSIYFFRYLMDYLGGATGLLRRNPNGNAVQNGGPNARRGLDPSIVSSFPTFVYSKVKSLRQEKNGLECAVCLAEFQDEDELRLITGCNHAFHPECIGLWFEAHTTCPVCRRNLDREDHQVSVAIVESDEREEDERSRRSSVKDDDDDGENPVMEEGRVIGRIVESERLRRSHSTGHSIGQRDDRFTLNLPEHVKEKITRGHIMSCITFGDYTGEISAGFSDHRDISRV